MGAPQKAHLSVQSDLSVLNRVQDWFRQFCLRNEDKLSWVTGQLYPLNLALAEGFTNAVRHAHRELPRETTIELDITLWEERIEIRIWDRGDPFDPNRLEEPVPGTLRLGGYGWFLLRRLTDRVDYLRSSDGRNCLLIVKYRQAGGWLTNRDESIQQNRMVDSRLS